MLSDIYVWLPRHQAPQQLTTSPQEIIVVDDGSNPPLQELFQKDQKRLDQDGDPACRLRFLRHNTTTGLMAAKLTGGREAGMEGDYELMIMQESKARGDVIAFIDCHCSPQLNWHQVDADFKWFDDESDFVPTISGGLVAMGRAWFNLTGGFDEGMHGWGGENLAPRWTNRSAPGSAVATSCAPRAAAWRTCGARATGARCLGGVHLGSALGVPNL
eukprot:Skav224818  [mRNA]  locus=scaffold21:184166:195508:+ [translate_table: standard]